MSGALFLILSFSALAVSVWLALKISNRGR